MQSNKIFFILLCIVSISQGITAVVNNLNGSDEEKIKKIENSTSTKDTSRSNDTQVPDSITVETKLEANRREAPDASLALLDSYGTPLLSEEGSTYIPSGPSNPGLPIPIYGVPDVSTNNIIYPEPPPDIPPPLPISSSGNIYGRPKPINTFDSNSLLGPPPPPPFHSKNLNKLNAVSFESKPPTNFNSFSYPSKPLKNSFHSFIPHSNHGRPTFIQKSPKFNYGPPKSQYGLPKPHLPLKPQYGVPPSTKHQFSSSKPSEKYTTSVKSSANRPTFHYGPPEPVPHGPPHPGAPAPPTPPDIKYDGWQPIPGLVSRPPSNTYGVPTGSHNTKDLHFNSDFTPPPFNNQGLSHTHSSYTSNSHGSSDSYGAPLNTVTGSGGIVSSSGDAHHDDHSLSLGLSAAGISPSGPNQLSVIKSIEYELFPNTGQGVNSYSLSLDSYRSPPSNSYSVNGPYAAAHSYNINDLSEPLTSIGGINSHAMQLSSDNIGLVPPSGLYGVPPSGEYGTPLLSIPSSQYGAPLNALSINPPKQPVIFREPVPPGLIESIGKHTAHKDTLNIIENSHSGTNNIYIPPPIPELRNHHKKETVPLSDLYALPNVDQSATFHQMSHGMSNGVSSNQLNFDGFKASLTSYSAPPGIVDESYNLPLGSDNSYSVANLPSDGATVGIDHSHPPLTIDLTRGHGVNSIVGLQNSGYDCQKSHSLNSYIKSSINTINSVPPLHVNEPQDLHASYSQQVNSGTIFNNLNEKPSADKTYGKSLAESFGPNNELIKSKPIDISNIPVTENLGGYTLQTQSAGEANSAPQQVSHAQVLNNGLLQSILAAIEQPQKDQIIFGQPLVQFQPVSEKDVNEEGSLLRTVVVPAPDNNSTLNNDHSNSENILKIIDNNEIALYFNNKSENKDVLINTQPNGTFDEVRNAQQYGSYVSFKTPSGGYTYTDLEHSTNQKTDADSSAK